MFSVRNGLEQGDALSLLLFAFVLEYAIRRVQGNQDGLILMVYISFRFFANDVYILGGSVHTINKNAEALILAGKEI